MSSTQKSAAILLIGNEMLSGRTQDKNVQYMAQRFTELGITLHEVRIIPDDEARIIAAVQHFHQAVDYVFTTGGIGPTHDDITCRSVAKAFERDVVEDPEALRRLKAHYDGTDQPLNEARRKMAHIPQGAQLIDNPISAAPGFLIEHVYVMAGVPRIMQAMFAGIEGHLQGGEPFHSHSITTTMREGDIAPALQAIQEQYPQIDIGSYPYFRDGGFGVSVVLRSQDQAGITQAADTIKTAILDLSGHIVDG